MKKSDADKADAWLAKREERRGKERPEPDDGMPPGYWAMSLRERLNWHDKERRKRMKAKRGA